MAAHVGIQAGDKFGLTTPVGGFAQETSRKSAKEWVSVKNESGVTVENDPLPVTKRDITMRGKGSPNFALITAAVVATGALKVFSVKLDEGNKDKPSFEYQAEIYENDEEEG